MKQNSTSLKYEPSSEPLHIPAKWLFLHRGTQHALEASCATGIPGRHGPSACVRHATIRSLYSSEESLPDIGAKATMAPIPVPRRARPGLWPTHTHLCLSTRRWTFCCGNYSQAGVRYYCQVDVLVLRYRFVNFGSGTSPVSPNWSAGNRLRQS